MESKKILIVNPPSMQIYRFPYDPYLISTILDNIKIENVVYDWNLDYFTKLFKINDDFKKDLVSNKELINQKKSLVSMVDLVSKVGIGSINFVAKVESKLDVMDSLKLNNLDLLYNEKYLKFENIVMVATTYSQVIFAVLFAKKNIGHKVYLVVNYTADLVHLDIFQKYFAGIYYKIEDFINQKCGYVGDVPLDILINPNKIIINNYLLVDPVVPLRLLNHCYYGKCFFCDRCGARGKNIQVDLAKICSYVRYWKTNQKINKFKFLDDALFPADIIKLSKMLIDQQIKIKWQGNIRFDNLFLIKDNIDILAKAGCVKLFVGLESASQRMLDRMNKKTKIDNIQKIIRKISANGIDLKISIMFNFPGETLEDVKETIQFIMSNENYIYKLEVNGFMLHKNSYVYQHQEEFNIQIQDSGSYFAAFNDMNITLAKFLLKQKIINEFVDYLINNNKLESDWESNYKVWEK